MKLIVRFSFTQILLLLFFAQEVKSNPLTGSLPVFEADNPFSQYVGRIDFSNVKRPRFWSQGVYIKAKFKGTYCELLVNDQELCGKNHTYLDIVIDNKSARIQATEKNNCIVIVQELSNTAHTVIQ